MTRREEIIQIAGSILGGMMCNPNWLKYAQERAATPDQGDVPHQYVSVAKIYAERLIDLVDADVKVADE